jgi:hypothetical protein
MRLALIMRATRQQMSLQAGLGQEEHNACDEVILLPTRSVPSEWYCTIMSAWDYIRNNELLTGQ